MAASRRRSSLPARSPSSKRLTRRDFIGWTGALAGGAVFGGPLAATCAFAHVAAADIAPDAIWGEHGAAARIAASLAHVSRRAFRHREFDVTHYGARSCATVAQTSPYPSAKSPVSPGAELTTAPGAFDSRPAFLAAIDACAREGGGRVIVPAGNWYCAGPIVLQSNVNFHLSVNCTIYFSPNPADYAKDGPVDCGANGRLYYSRWQANDCLNYGAPVYARNATNIALTGEGATSVLNGQAMTPFAGSGAGSVCWWTYKGSSGAYGGNASGPSQAFANPNNVDLRLVAPAIPDALYALLTSPVTPWQQDQNYLPALSEAGVPVERRIFGLGHYLRPCMVEFIGCTNVLMENYQTQNTPFWQHHPTASRNVVIRGVTTNSIGPNNDGFDPDACTDVLCERCTFNTGDDCIAIKSGKDRDTEYGPAKRHLIRDCTMNSGHGGITLGSEMGGGVEQIYATNLSMLNANWQTNPLNIAIRVKTNMNRGGYVKDFHVKGVVLPNGVNLKGGGYGSALLAGSPINASVALGVVTAAAGNPSAAQGGIVTFDCDYQPANDAVRTRPPVVQNVTISDVKASNVTLNGVSASCFQAIVAQGPVAFDYNGAPPTPAVQPISGVTISNCDFGTPVTSGASTVTSPGPIYAFNVSAMTLANVTIGGQVVDTSITDRR
ncbi:MULTISPECIES: glycoside hydrolase family 28 protein [Burkholderia]|uniref:glycoside hydrolase family 28 protein n=1 Tax=Burkholderia TaxID=32008 RepID=UPI00054FFF9B|nr:MULTISPECIES: glycoside hydrolase family 28 protein [Burkholderia]TCT34000.1 polygalacturonase [Burkholderia vietnamiensis]SCZ38643.1 Polygalacturonase [Burkholderia vietnamiensis]SFY18465.1 Polygalacturonase [Burkholderia vietnamiensis]